MKPYMAGDWVLTSVKKNNWLNVKSYCNIEVEGSTSKRILSSLKAYNKWTMITAFYSHKVSLSAVRRLE